LAYAGMIIELEDATLTKPPAGEWRVLTALESL
jgi:hypothetical protein